MLDIITTVNIFINWPLSSGFLKIKHFWVVYKFVYHFFTFYQTYQRQSASVSAVEGMEAVATAARSGEVHEGRGKRGNGHLFKLK